MEVNGDSGPMEEMRTVHGETIPPIQADFGGSFGEPVFLQAEEEISVRRSIQAMRGDVAPIVQEQEQLHQDVQDLVNEAASVLYNTAVRSEQSLAELRQDTGAALSIAEEAVGQVGSSVQTLGSQVEQMSANQQAVLERAWNAERKADTLAKQLQESQQEQVAMLAALEHQKAV